jgi:hypothetical protein
MEKMLKCPLASHEELKAQVGSLASLTTMKG